MLPFYDERAYNVYMLIPFDSEVFGAAEDNSPEMDRSEDSENGERSLEMQTCSWMLILISNDS